MKRPVTLYHDMALKLYQPWVMLSSILTYFTGQPMTQWRILMLESYAWSMNSHKTSSWNSFTLYQTFFKSGSPTQVCCIIVSNPIEPITTARLPQASFNPFQELMTLANNLDWTTSLQECLRGHSGFDLVPSTGSITDIASRFTFLVVISWFICARLRRAYNGVQEMPLIAKRKGIRLIKAVKFRMRDMRYVNIPSPRSY